MGTVLGVWAEEQPVIAAILQGLANICSPAEVAEGIGECSQPSPSICPPSWLPGLRGRRVYCALTLCQYQQGWFGVLISSFEFILNLY